MSVVDRNGRHTARVRVAGYPTYTKTFDTADEAEKWIITIKAQIIEGKRPATTKQSKYTFAQVIKAYQEHCEPNQGEQYKLNIIGKDFGELYVLNLTAPMLAAYIKAYLNTEVKPPANKKKDHPLYNGDVKRKYSDSHVRKIYFTLKKLMTWHSGFKNYPLVDIFAVVKPPSTDIKRDRLLTLPELDRLYTACDKMYVNQQSWKDAILVSTETALRAGEQLALLWSDIELSKRRINVRKEVSKTKKYREVPMTTPVFEVLKRRYEERKQGENRVFPEWANSNALAHRFKVIVKNAGLGDYKWHDNRHYAITNLFLKTTLRDTEIASISGHTNMTTLRRYTHLRSEELYKKLW